MIVADDWGGGDWWEFQPPPPDDDDRDQWENWEEDYEYSPIGIPPEPDWPEVDLENPKRCIRLQEKRGPG